jgi:hypothetical protein
MPQIIVTAGAAADLGGTVMLRERINVSDFESERFAANLIERLGWAVCDADEVEQQAPSNDEQQTPSAVEQQAPSEDEQHEQRSTARPRELVKA